MTQYFPESPERDAGEEMQKALHTPDATFLCMGYEMDKIQQKFLVTAGLLFFAILLSVIILATGFQKDLLPDIPVIVVILLFMLVIVTGMMSINRIHASSRYHEPGNKTDEKQETLRSNIKMWSNCGRAWNG